MSSDWYEVSGAPSTKSFGSSAAIRGEFQLLAQSFAKMPALTGSAGYFLKINDSGTAMEALDAEDAREALGLIIGETVQAYSAALASTTASFTTELASKLNGLTIGETVQAFSSALAATTASFTTDLKEKLEAMVDGGEFIIPPSETDPATPDSGGIIFVKAFEGNPELFYKDSAGNVIRLTYKGDSAISLPDSDVTFDSIRTRSFMRGTVVNVPVVDGEATIDWSLGTVYRLEISEDTDLYLTNMPDIASGEEQTIYVDVTTTGAQTLFIQSTYALEFPLGVNTGVTPDGRDFFVCACNNGSLITIAPLTNLGTGD
jgi:hypothetical protein